MSVLVSRNSGRRLLGAQALVMAAFLVGLTWTIHDRGGLRALHHGPTLSNQIAVACELERDALEVVQPSEVLHVRMFPHAIGVIRRLERGGAPPSAEGQPFRGRAEIAYRDPDGVLGEITVRRAPSATGSSGR